MHAEKIEIGRGVLDWAARERRTDRYGSVSLFDAPDGRGKVVPLRVVTGRGRLIAEVVATRASYHVGDWIRGFYPSTPAKEEIVVLAETGTIFGNHPGACVGVRPDDARTKDWLDPAALYRAHNQTVILWWEPEL